TTADMLLGKWTVVGATKDLKPASLMVFRRMRVPRSRWREPGGDGSSAGPERSTPSTSWVSLVGRLANTHRNLPRSVRDRPVGDACKAAQCITAPAPQYVRASRTATQPA